MTTEALTVAPAAAYFIATLVRGSRHAVMAPGQDEPAIFNRDKPRIVTARVKDYLDRTAIDERTIITTLRDDGAEGSQELEHRRLPRFAFEPLADDVSAEEVLDFEPPKLRPVAEAE